MTTTSETLPKIISGWSCKSGMGVNTFLLAAALESANRGYRTAFVELDTINYITSLKTGLSHEKRNLESWLEYRKKENAYIALDDYLLNSHIWLNDSNQNKNKALSQIVSEIDRNLFFLTASSSLNRFSAYEIPIYLDTVNEIIQQLKALDYEAIFFDLPSEVLSVATVPAMKLSDEIIVLIDGDLANTLYTRSQLDYLIKEIEPHRIKIVLNRVPKNLVPNIEANLDMTSWLVVPDDPDMFESSLDMRNTGGTIFKKSISEFLDKVYLKAKKNYKSNSLENKAQKKGIINIFKKKNVNA